MEKFRIKELRKNKGWTQTKLGNEMKPTAKQQQIQVWENADNLEQATLERIALALGVSVIDLYVIPPTEGKDTLSPEEREALSIVFKDRDFYNALIDLYQLTKELPPEVSDRLVNVLSQLLRPRRGTTESETNNPQ